MFQDLSKCEHSIFVKLVLFFAAGAVNLFVKVNWQQDHVERYVLSFCQPWNVESWKGGLITYYIRMNKQYNSFANITVLI